MTYLPREQLINTYNPGSIYPLTSGQGLIPLVQSFNVINILSTAYCGNGIVLAGTSDGHIWRDVNYGAGTWTDIGVVSPSAINIIIYIGNGIVILGDNTGNIKRSRDYGVNWVTIVTAGGAIYSLSHVGNGFIYAGTAAYGLPAKGHLSISLNFGATFFDTGPLSVAGTDAGNITSITFMDGPPGLATGNDYIAIDSNGKVFRSNFGITDVKTLNNGVANLVSTYIGNNILIVANNNGEVYRSSDRGGTWNLITTLGAPPTGLANMGNGLIAYCRSTNVVLRGSFDAGITWGSWAGILSPVTMGSPTSMCYLGNGILVIGTSLGRIFRAVNSFTINESIGLIDSSLISITSDQTVGQSHNMVDVDATGGNIVITLANPTSFQIGHELVIKKIDVTSNTVTITPAAGTIDGIANKTLSIPYQYVIIRTDGTNWFIISDFVVASSINPISHLTPAITRYETPGWCANTLGRANSLGAGVIHYVPFFVAETTTYIDISVENAASIQTGSVACIIYNWNAGVPGSQVLNVGTFSWAGEFNAVKTIVINLTLNRGFYFVAFRLASGTIGLYEIDRSGTAPVSSLKGTGSPTPNPTNLITMTVTAALADPAPAPTGLSDTTPIFLMKTHA